jgi:hypothetical protein
MAKRNKSLLQLKHQFHRVVHRFLKNLQVLYIPRFCVNPFILHVQVY